MKTNNQFKMETNHEFFSGFLQDIVELAKNDRLSVVEFIRHSDKKRIFCLAATRINPVSGEFEFDVIAKFFDKNPNMSMSLAEKPLHASQRSIEEWAQEHDMSFVNCSALN